LSKEEKPQRKPWLIDIPGSVKSTEVRIFPDTDKPEPVTPGTGPDGVRVFPNTDKPVPQTPGTVSPNEAKPRPATPVRKEQVIE
jgi:hypothetical protein